MIKTVYALSRGKLKGRMNGFGALNASSKLRMITRQIRPTTPSLVDLLVSC